MALLHSQSLTDQIAIFTDVPRETLEKAEIKNLEKISLTLSFLSTIPKDFGRTVMVGPYVLPVDVTIQSLGQFEDLRGLLLKMPKDMKDPINMIENSEKFGELCLKACAIYCQKVRDGVYDNSKAMIMTEELKNYSCVEVIGTGAFFSFRVWNTSSPIQNLYLKVRQLLKRSIAVLPGYRKTLDFLQRSSGSQGK
jgi:hypothetical protein